MKKSIKIAATLAAAVVVTLSGSITSYATTLEMPVHSQNESSYVEEMPSSRMPIAVGHHVSVRHDAVLYYSTSTSTSAWGQVNRGAGGRVTSIHNNRAQFQLSGSAHALNGNPAGRILWVHVSMLNNQGPVASN